MSIGRILIGIFLKKNGQDMLFWLFFCFCMEGRLLYYAIFDGFFAFWRAFECGLVYFLVLG